MWQNDTVTLQTGEEVNNLGSIKVTWTDAIDVTCDVQDISKELVYKNYGFTKAMNYKQVFDQTDSLEVAAVVPLDDFYPSNDSTPSEFRTFHWVEGNQVIYEEERYMIKLVNGNMDKMSLSNHVFIILQQVV